MRQKSQLDKEENLLDKYLKNQLIIRILFQKRVTLILNKHLKLIEVKVLMLE